MQIRQCLYCQGDFDAMRFKKGPPRRYCSASCRTKASHKRAREGTPDPARVLQGRIGMAERWGRHDEANAYREQLKKLGNE